MNFNVIKNQIKQDARFETFYAELIKYNQKFNLTAITDKEDVYLKHFLDSAAPLDIFESGSYVLDIGAGAGFPSIPLKLLRSDLQFLTVDSSNKKIGFVNNVIKTLGLTGISALHCRIEDLDVKDFDYVIARALAPLNVLCEYALPYLKIGGHAIFYKADISKELPKAKSAIHFLGGKLDNIFEYFLEKYIKRTLIIIEKTKAGPVGYPRSLNRPRKKPL